MPAAHGQDGRARLGEIEGQLTGQAQAALVEHLPHAHHYVHPQAGHKHPHPRVQRQRGARQHPTHAARRQPAQRHVTGQTRRQGQRSREQRQNDQRQKRRSEPEVNLPPGWSLRSEPVSQEQHADDRVGQVQSRPRVQVEHVWRDRRADRPIDREGQYQSQGVSGPHAGLFQVSHNAILSDSLKNGNAL